ncbi:MAG: SGNH/GDSL hydrolase family protein [Oscillospiraceae bacterium]|nr:SGNH/GDSL hydrolase family protein [Oscillospiraceae bacterium]
MKHVLCFGDSNTYGLKPEWIQGSFGRHDENTRWPGKMRNLLGDDYRVIEEGQCGRTTVFEDPTFPMKSGINYLRPCIESHTPLDLIIIMLGTNDTKGMFNASAAEIAAGLGRLIQTAKDPAVYMGGPVPKVLVAVPVPLGEVATTLPDGITTMEMVEKSRALAARYEATAQMHGCEFIDLGKVAETAPFEGVHITAEGHAKIAEAMAAKVREILE